MNRRVRLKAVAAAVGALLWAQPAGAKKAAPCKPKDTIAVKGGGVKGLAMSPDGKWMATANKDGTASILDLKGKLLKSLKGHSAELSSIAISPDGKLVATGSEDKKIMLWEMPSGKQRAVLTGHNHTVKGLSFTPEGEALLSGSLDKQMGNWDPVAGKLNTMVGGQACILNGVVASRNTYGEKNWMVGGACNDGLVRLYNLKTGKMVLALEKHEGEVHAVAFATTPVDGQHPMVTGDNDGKVIVWDVFGKTARLVLDAGWTDAVAFSPDAKLVVGAGNDMAAHGMFKLWETKDGKLLNEQFPHDGNVTGVVFTPDGRLMFTGSMDETVKVWDVEQLKKGCG